MVQCGCPNPLYYSPYLANNCGGNGFVLFMALVDSIIRNTCDVSDVCGRVHARSQPFNMYDYIVIGGGTGGSTVTGRLAEDGRNRVLLIEAGPDEPETYQVPGLILKYFRNPILDWNYMTSNEPIACQGTNGSCLWLRAKILGGNSVINGMMFIVGIPEDFNKRWEKEGGNPGWGWKDVQPFFKKFENNLQGGLQYSLQYHGVGGPVTVSDQYYTPELAKAVLQGAKEAGFSISRDLNGVNYTGFAIPQSYIKDGSRVSMAKAYLRPLRNDPRLNVMLNSTVTKILIDKNKRAYAVEFIYKNISYTVKARKEIILAAGTINSPKILLQSGVGPKDALDSVGIKQIHDLPGVGRNLSNHVAFQLVYWVNSTTLSSSVTWDTIREYLSSRTGPLASAGIPVTARLHTKYATKEDPDIQLYFQESKQQCSTTGSPYEPIEPKQPNTLSISAVNLHPKSRGRITLNSANPLDPPNMVGNYLTVVEDEDRLLEGIRLVQRLANSTTLKDTWKLNYANKVYGDCGDKNVFDTDEYWRCAIRHSTDPENHQASALRMGPTTDRWSVLNQELQVIGIKDLRVADASAMPVVTSGNINAAIIMVAERCADFIKRRLRY